MIIALSFLLGAAIGSFVNVLVWRTREGISLFLPPSQCVVCKRAILWRDNIPLFGFFALGGKCRWCRIDISWQYPAVEFVMGAAFAGAAWLHGVSDIYIPVALARDWVILVALVAVFLYDARYGEIPDRFTLLPAGALFLASLAFGWQQLGSMLLGIAVGVGFFLLQFVLSRGRAIGGGDIRLGAFMGVILGWPDILVGLFVSYILGASVGIVLLAQGKKRFGDAIPFGIFLAVGTAIAMFWGKLLLSWYVSLVSY